MNAHCSSAVDIRGAEKRYGSTSNSKPTFTRLNLNLPRGNIYALLGPSGCGKTTLLRCILGRLQLDKGSVSVFGHLPGSKESGIPGPTVGYMSQENSIYITMSIGEYLWYFATIFGIPSEQIRTKTNYYTKLLKLPPKRSLNSTLSGGELRRVQFAAALIHDPKLLVLDEPTVGIDVMTKLSMWQHLMKLTKENGSSVLLTTHYIEEARLADRVGMIHGCTMAAEDSTDNLMRRYNETTLEGVFLKICYTGIRASIHVEVNDGVMKSGSDTNGREITEINGNNRKVTALEINGNSRKITTLEINRNESFCDEDTRKVSSSTRYDFNVAWHRLFPIVVRSCIGLYRFPGAFMLLILLPVIQVVLYLVTMGNPVGGIPMTIVNEDVGEFGAQYLSYLKPDIIIQKPYRDYDTGFQAVWHGESYGILHIKSNFSSAFQKKYLDFSIINGDFLDSAIIGLQMDNTNLNIAKFAEYHLLDMFHNFLKDSLSSAGIDPAVVQLPMNVSQETIETLTRPPSIYVLSGLVVLISYCNSIPPAIFNVFMERHQGYMEPNLIAGVTPLEIILGTLLFQVVFLAIQNLGIVLIALLALLEHSKGSIFLLFSLLYVQGFGGTALGIATSLMFTQTTVIFGVLVFIMFLAPGFSGMFLPVESMPTFFLYFTQCFPFALPCRAVEVIIHRGWDLSYFTVYSAFGVSFLWIFIFLAIAFWLFSRLK